MNARIRSTASDAPIDHTPLPRGLYQAIERNPTEATAIRRDIHSQLSLERKNSGLR